jgi:pyrroloquinoline quinone (PQQ) biosynthesis protein C
MANSKGINDYMVQESVAPYVSAVVASTNDQDVCRAIYVKVAGNYD